MATKPPLSQTGDAAPSTSSTSSTLEKSEANDQKFHDSDMGKETPKDAEAGVDGELADSSGQDGSSPGGFTLLMTVTALAMSMFLVCDYNDSPGFKSMANDYARKQVSLDMVSNLSKPSLLE